MPFRPSIRPIDTPTGTVPIDEHPETKDIVHDIKKRLREDQVGASSWVGITPHGDIIVTNDDGTAENLGPWDTYC